MVMCGSGKCGAMCVEMVGGDEIVRGVWKWLMVVMVVMVVMKILGNGGVIILEMEFGVPK